MKDWIVLSLMGAMNTKQMKFGVSWSEEENMKSGRSEQGHKRWDNTGQIGQSQNLRHGRGDKEDPAADAERCGDNLWQKSKERQEGEERESFETGFQPDLGGWVDCGYQDISWSSGGGYGGDCGCGGGGGGGGGGQVEEEELEVGRRLPLQVSRKLPIQVERELPMQVMRKLPLQVDPSCTTQVDPRREIPSQVRRELPMQVDGREPIQFMNRNRNGAFQ